MTSYEPTVEQWINIGLTVVIAIAVIAQAWFTKKQAPLLETSEKRARDRDKPAVRIVSSQLSVSHRDAGGVLTATGFEGFIVTNAGFLDIEITSFAFEVGRLPNSGEDDSPTAEIVFSPVTEFAQVTVSTMSLPHRLRRGESFSVRYDNALLVNESKGLGGEAPVHLRPYCHDSLRNKHMPDHWFVYLKVNSTAAVEVPRPGRISEEAYDRLSRTEKQRYSRWTRRVA